MLIRRALAVFALLCAFVSPTYAQSTKAQILTEIPQLCPPGQTIGLCSVPGANQIWSDIVNSIMPTAPVTSGNLACFDGTTGLLKDCGSTPALTITSGLTPTSGYSAGQILSSTGTVLSAYSVSGSGNVALTTGPVFTNPVVGTQISSDNSTKAASTAFVATAIAGTGTGTTAGFQTLAAASSAMISGSVTTLFTEGYAAANDGGGGWYNKLASPPTPQAWNFQSVDGAWWQLSVPAVYPRQMGATCNGTTDDSVATQAWVNYSSTFGVAALGQACTLNVPTATINLPSNTYIDGLKQLTVERTTDIVAALFQCQSSTNVTVKRTAFGSTSGFTSTTSNTIVNGSKTFSIPAGKTLTVGNFVQITSNSQPANYMIAQITGYSGTTLSVTATTSVGSGTYTSWTIASYPMNGDLAAVPVALQFQVCTHDLADDNVVTGLFYDAIDSRNGIDDTFNNNNVSGYVNRGIHAASYLSFSGSELHITNNTITSPNFAQYGINVSATDSAALQQVVVSGNVINGPNFQGINLAGALQYSTVSANTVIMFARSSVGVGILVEGIGSLVTQRVAVTGNTIFGAQSGILAINTFYDTFSGNSITDSVYGMQIVGTGTGYLTITGNNVSSCSSHGFYFQGISSGGITGLSVTGNTSIINGGWGFLADSNTSNFSISGNVTGANTSGGYSLSGSGFVSAANI